MKQNSGTKSVSEKLIIWMGETDLELLGKYLISDSFKNKIKEGRQVGLVGRPRDS